MINAVVGHEYRVCGNSSEHVVPAVVVVVVVTM